MINRIFLDVITNIFGIFILIILYFLIDFSKISSMTIDGVLLPLEEKSNKNFYYLEVVGDNVIPVGLGGKCDKDIYKVIELTNDSFACIIPNEVLASNRDKYNIYSNKTRYKKLIESLSKEEIYFVLLTRPSSFHIYHDVAKNITTAGFEVGWSPIDEDSPLKFSPNGRRVGTQ